MPFTFFFPKIYDFYDFYASWEPCKYTRRYTYSFRQIGRKKDGQIGRQTKQTNGGTDLLMDRHVVELTEQLTDGQRDIKTKSQTKQDVQTTSTVHADVQIG